MSAETRTRHYAATTVVTHVPKLAAWIGGLGLIPFVALGTASYILGPTRHGWADGAVALYGAIILSFLGGIHWGLSIAVGGKISRASAIQLGTSILPPLIAWGTLFLPRPAGLPAAEHGPR